MRIIWTIILGLAAAFAAQAPAASETDAATRTPSAAELELQERERLLKLQADIAKHRKTIRDANKPDTDATPLPGGVKTEKDGGIDAGFMAYEALDAAAKRVAEKACSLSSQRTIAIVPLPDVLERLQLYGLINARLDRFAERFRVLDSRARALERPVRPSWRPRDRYPATAAALSVPTALVSLAGLLGATADLAAYFRTETTVTGRKVDIEDAALVAAIRSVGSAECTWKVPGLSGQRGPLLGRLMTISEQAENLRHYRASVFLPALSQADREVDQKRRAYEAAKAAKPPDESNIAKLREELNKALTARENLAETDRLSAEYQSVLALWDAYFEALTVGTAERPAPITALATLDRAGFGQEAGETTHILFVEISLADADVFTTKSLWHGGRIGFRGGVALTWFLTDMKGEVINAGIERHVRGDSLRPREMNRERSKESGPQRRRRTAQ